MDLGDYDEAESALIELAKNENEDWVILASCGASIAEIWHRKEKFDQAILDTLSPSARAEVKIGLRSMKYRVSLDPEKLEGLDLSGRPFLHQQGSAICRGFTTKLEVSETQWVLKLNQVEYLNKETSMWELKFSEDEYCGEINCHWAVTWYKDTDMFYIPGHGFETYVGPQTEAPWSDINWPSTGNFPGGKMN